MARESLASLSGDAALAELISTAIAPDSWRVNGGCAYFRIINGLLIVSQSEQTHQEIQDLLEKLRRAAAARSE